MNAGAQCGAARTASKATRLASKAPAIGRTRQWRNDDDPQDHLGSRLPSPLGAAAMPAPALAQNEQFLPALVYRTGPYAPNGIPFANGVADYWTLLNERDGGINGVKIVFEECETGYATDKGVECYERLKGKGPTGAGYFSPLSTGITFALTEKVPGDKIPLLTMGYGRSESRERRGVPVELHRRSAPTGPRPTSPSSTSPRSSAASTSSRARRSASSITTAPTARSRSRRSRRAPRCNGFDLQGDPGHASGRRAEVAVARDPPGPARLRAAVGLGRDELDRDQGGRRPSAIRATR